jgi:hypothetical protein
MHGAAAWEKVKHGAGRITVQAEAWSRSMERKEEWSIPQTWSKQNNGAEAWRKRKHEARGSIEQTHASEAWSRFMEQLHGADAWSK